MTDTTRTLNPLPFEALEPKRFEDLTRQLIYDFRRWKQLEPVGKLGNDDGMDIRAYEWYSPEEPMDDEEMSEEKLPEKLNERLWKMQCKREKVITPKKMGQYLKESFPDGAGIPYGFIFSAACDFSKDTHDIFRNFMVNKGVQEFYLWGKASLEDMLFLPKNDHLLFAYFGISLQIKKRIVRQNIRTRLAIKRKITSILGGLRAKTFIQVLIRNADDTDYPNEEKQDVIKNGQLKWLPVFFIRQEPEGLVFMFRENYAFMNEKEEWDYLKDLNILHSKTNFSMYWPKQRREVYEKKSILYRNYFQLEMHKEESAILEIFGIIPYENIIDIDKDGDAYFHCAHLYIEFTNQFPFTKTWAKLMPSWMEQQNRKEIYPDDKKKVKYFPAIIPVVQSPPPLKMTPIDEPGKIEEKTSTNLDKLKK